MKVKDLRLILEHLLECYPQIQAQREPWSERHQAVTDLVRAEIDKKDDREARRELKSALGYSRVGRDAMRRG